MTLEVTGNLVSIGIPGSPSPSTLSISSIDSVLITGVSPAQAVPAASEGSGLLVNGTVLSLRMRLASTDILFQQLEIAFTHGYNETLAFTFQDGSTRDIICVIDEFVVQADPLATSGTAQLVSLALRITDDNP